MRMFKIMMKLKMKSNKSKIIFKNKFKEMIMNSNIKKYQSMRLNTLMI